MTASEKAWELIQRLSSAAGDITIDLERYPTEEYELWCRANQDVQDKVGAYADHIYCDADFQQDFLGDWSFEFSEDHAQRIVLFRVIKERESNFATACDKLIYDAEKRMV